MQLLQSSVIHYYYKLISIIEPLFYPNRPKKFMQVGINVKFIHTNFGGCGLFGFGDTAILKNGQFSLSDHGL